MTQFITDSFRSNIVNNIVIIKYYSVFNRLYQQLLETVNYLGTLICV